MCEGGNPMDVDLAIIIAADRGQNLFARSGRTDEAGFLPTGGAMRHPPCGCVIVAGDAARRSVPKADHPAVMQATIPAQTMAGNAILGFPSEIAAHPPNLSASWQWVRQRQRALPLLLWLEGIETGHGTGVFRTFSRNPRPPPRRTPGEDAPPAFALGPRERFFTRLH